MESECEEVKISIDQQIEEGITRQERIAQISELCVSVIDHALKTTKQNSEMIQTLREYLELELSPDTPKMYTRGIFKEIAVNIADYALMCAGPSAPLITALHTITKLLPDQVWDEFRVA